MRTSVSNKKAALICVGSELLRGKPNTHVLALSQALRSTRLELAEERTLPDDLGRLTDAIREALTRHDVIIVTGGLGPTFDDLTREAAARACGRSLAISAALLKEIRRKFRRARYKKMPPANARQAELLEGAFPIPNAVGTAPGQWLDLTFPSPADRRERVGVRARLVPSSQPSPGTLAGRRRILVLLPGPPRELVPMLDRYVMPRLRKLFPARNTAEAHLHFAGVPESLVDDKIRPIIGPASDAQFTILAHLGLVDLDIFVSGKTRSAAHRRLGRLVRQIRRAVGPSFYGQDEDYPLEKVVQDRFLRRKATLAVAESCTGGMLSQRLTDVPGSSRYFLGGVVAYSNDVKMAFLGVPAEVLKEHGAVSSETASAMARGIRDAFASDWGLSITGIAGPGGGTPRKPVGSVYIGLAGPKSVTVKGFRFNGSRDAVRARSVVVALDMLRLIYL
jgi:nicotinamide-nucleotide amidase